jgi:hypothetical protein
MKATWGGVGSKRGGTEELGGEGEGLGQSGSRSDRAEGFDPSPTRPIGLA